MNTYTYQISPSHLIKAWLAVRTYVIFGPIILPFLQLIVGTAFNPLLTSPKWGTITAVRGGNSPGKQIVSVSLGFKKLTRKRRLGDKPTEA